MTIIKVYRATIWNFATAPAYPLKQKNYWNFEFILKCVLNLYYHAMILSIWFKLM
jgi:hypothetical protein